MKDLEKKVSTLFWVIAGVFAAGWLVGFVLQAGAWIHSLLVVALLLALFDFMYTKKQLG